MKYSIGDSIKVKNPMRAKDSGVVQKIRKYAACTRYYCISIYGYGFTVVEKN